MEDRGSTTRHGLTRTSVVGGSTTPFRLGVLGTLIWDRIFGPGTEGEPVEEWGGVSYSLEAFGATLPDAWVIQPILKIGEDLAEEAEAYLRSIPKLELVRGILVTSGTNPRVELRYDTGARRLERPSGGVPPWTEDEIGPFLTGLDGLYVNFITGMEMGLETAALLRRVFSGPLYADLHTLFTGISDEGFRFPRELADWERWTQAFDAVQMNEDEFLLTSSSGGNPWVGAVDLVGPAPKLIAVTMGKRGSAYLAAPGLSPDPVSWAALPGASGKTEKPRWKRIRPEKQNFSGDPTGCGDVWGATFFGGLLGGDSFEGAMAEANRLAAKNLEHRGARGLHLKLLDLTIR